MGATGIAELGRGAGLMHGREHRGAATGFVILRAPDAEPVAAPLIPARPLPVDAPTVPVAAGPGTAGPRAAVPGGAVAESAVPGAAVLGAAVPGAAPPGPVNAVHPDAHRFVLSTLRPMFEVLDRRRPAKHLTAIASGTVVDVLRVLADAGPPAQVTGWGRVHVAAPRAVPPRPRARADDPEVGAEIFLTYSRGDRVLAAAGRVESVAGRWRWVAFTTAA